MSNHIIQDIRNGKIPDINDAIKLLEIENFSDDFYELINYANYLTRSEFHNKGYVFAQIGLDAQPCSVDCKFCSMGESHYSLESTWKKDLNLILTEVKNIVGSGISDLFLMTTANYSLDEYLKIIEKVREFLPLNIRLVANIGDFNFQYALKLKNAGATGAYHIRRLGEGIDTKTTEKDRIKTLDAIKDAGLELYYCVEPIGPEHTFKEIATEMIRARDYNVGVMAVMRRIAVPGTPLFYRGQINSIELTRIAAVTRIVTMPHRAMNAHETTQMNLIAGVNQLYAEMGANPRDTVSSTENGRGFSIENTNTLLMDAGYAI